MKDNSKILVILCDASQTDKEYSRCISRDSAYIGIIDYSYDTLVTRLSPYKAIFRDAPSEEAWKCIDDDFESGTSALVLNYNERIPADTEIIQLINCANIHGNVKTLILSASDGSFILTDSQRVEGEQSTEGHASYIPSYRLYDILLDEVTVTEPSAVEESESKQKLTQPQEEKEKKPLFESFYEWFELFVYSLVGVILLMTFGIRQSPVEGSSMYPTLIGHSSVDTAYTVTSGYDKLLISNLFYTPERFDVVIIQEPSQFTEPIVKRIIAIGGDTIKLDFNTGDVYVNGELLEEDYACKDGTIQAENLEVDQNNCWEGVVPEGHVFVLGDHRSVSKDSRYFGYIDQRYIIGRVLLRISPAERFGSVD